MSFAKTNEKKKQTGVSHGKCGGVGLFWNERKSIDYNLHIIGFCFDHIFFYSIIVLQ